MLASGNNHLDVIDYLLLHHADLNITNKVSSHHHLLLLHHLILSLSHSHSHSHSHRCSVASCCCQNAMTALHYAAYKDRSSVIMKLLDAGADSTIKDKVNR